MKNLRLLIVAVVISAVATFSASAQQKIASVNLKKLVNGYYKTKLAEDALQNHVTELQKEIKDMADGLEKSKVDYKQLLDQANDQARSQDDRAKLNQAATDKAKDISNSQVALQQFQRQAEAQLTDQKQRMLQDLLDEIQKAVGVKAAAAGYMMVVNSSSPESAVVYVDPATDITASVLSQLNAGAPVDVSKPAASTSSMLPLNISTNLP